MAPVGEWWAEVRNCGQNSRRAEPTFQIKGGGDGAPIAGSSSWVNWRSHLHDNLLHYFKEIIQKGGKKKYLNPIIHRQPLLIFWFIIFYMLFIFSKNMIIGYIHKFYILLRLPSYKNNKAITRMGIVKKRVQINVGENSEELELEEFIQFW